MVTPVAAIDEIRRCMQSNDIGWPIVRWHESGIEEAGLYDEIAAKIALGYSQSRYSYEVADFVVNTLWINDIRGCGSELEIPQPHLLCKVYDAFDAGEMTNPSLPMNDPIKAYTDSMIANIVAEF